MFDKVLNTPLGYLIHYMTIIGLTDKNIQYLHVSFIKNLYSSSDISINTDRFLVIVTWKGKKANK